MGANTSTYKWAFRIRSVDPNSPLHGKINTFTDFIIAIQGQVMDRKLTYMQTQIPIKGLSQILIRVYDQLTDQQRDIHLELSPQTQDYINSQEFNHYDNEIESTLLCSLFREDYDSIEPKALRVTQVFENSPSFDAGLVAKEDFVLDCLDFQYFDIASFIEGFKEFERKFEAQEESGQELRLRLIVFNVIRQQSRYVTIVPDSAWGGAGQFGCEFGEGLANSLQNFYEAYLNKARATEQQQNQRNNNNSQQDYWEQQQNNQQQQSMLGVQGSQNESNQGFMDAQKNRAGLTPLQKALLDRKTQREKLQLEQRQSLNQSQETEKPKRDEQVVEEVLKFKGKTVVPSNSQASVLTQKENKVDDLNGKKNKNAQDQKDRQVNREHGEQASKSFNRNGDSQEDSIASGRKDSQKKRKVNLEYNRKFSQTFDEIYRLSDEQSVLVVRQSHLIQI